MEFKNRKTIRAQWYDYRSSWAYFVTICTKNRDYYFGEIVNWSMVLNELGSVTKYCWDQIPLFHPHCVIDEFVCMPNHIHGIIIIGESVGKSVGVIVGTHYMCPNTIPKKKDGCNPPLQKQTITQPIQQWQCVSESLWSIVRWFKIGVTKYAKQQNVPCVRQSRYHDHVIRNAWEFDRIRYYIQNNPKNRKEDRFS